MTIPLRFFFVSIVRLSMWAPSLFSAALSDSPYWGSQYRHPYGPERCPSSRLAILLVAAFSFSRVQGESAQ